MNSWDESWLYAYPLFREGVDVPMILARRERKAIYTRYSLDLNFRP